jgi:hypothetical protein
MSKQEEELEFIAVSNDDEHEMNNYMRSSVEGMEGDGGGNNSIIGSWILNQSKV